MFKSTFKVLTASVLIAGTFLSAGCKKNNRTIKEVVIYTYDSFGADWAAGPQIASLFEESTGYKVKFIIKGSAVEALEQVIAEKKNPKADVIIGIDNNLLHKARKEKVLQPYEAHGTAFIKPEILNAFGDDNLLTPYDYSHFAIIRNTKDSTPVPSSLEDLTSPIYKDKLVIMNPSTSSTGLGFLSWTTAVYGDKTEDYWERLTPSIHAMTKGWSEGWGLFTKGEAPFVLSYTTSPAYCALEEKNEDFVALCFDQGHVMQVEGAGLINKAYNEKGGKTFIDFLIQSDAQKIIPGKQYMYPANKNIRINKSFSKVSPVPSVTLPTDTAKTESYIKKVVKIINK